MSPDNNPLTYSLPCTHPHQRLCPRWFICSTSASENICRTIAIKYVPRSCNGYWPPCIVSQHPRLSSITSQTIVYFTGIKLIGTILWTTKTIITRAFALYRGWHMSVYLCWQTRWIVSPKSPLWQDSFLKLTSLNTPTWFDQETSSLEKAPAILRKIRFCRMQSMYFIAHRSLTALQYISLQCFRVCLGLYPRWQDFSTFFS